MNPCLCCSRPIPPSRFKFCSEACKKEHDYAAQAARRRGVRTKPPPDEAQVRRAREALADGVKMEQLRARFPAAVLEKARQTL